MDLALNKLQKLICHKFQQNKPNQSNKLNMIYKDDVRSFISYKVILSK